MIKPFWNYLPRNNNVKATPEMMRILGPEEENNTNISVHRERERERDTHKGWQWSAHLN